MSTKAEKLNAMLAGDAATTETKVETAAAGTIETPDVNPAGEANPAPAPAKGAKKTVKPTAPAAQAEVFTDANMDTIENGNVVKVRIGNKVFDGVITGLKQIEADQFAHVLLTGKTASKMYHTGDITYVSKGTPPPADEAKPKSTITVKKGVTTFIAAEDNSPEENPLEKVKKERKNAAKEKPAKEKKEARDTPEPGSKSYKIMEMLKGGATRAEVVKALDAHYSFVMTIEKRYCPEIVPVKKAKKAPVATEAAAAEVPAEAVVEGATEGAVEESAAE